MGLLRHLQPALTRIFPHQANRRFIKSAQTRFAVAPVILIPLGGPLPAATVGVPIVPIQFLVNPDVRPSPLFRVIAPGTGLPAGLTLNATSGRLSGTPTAPSSAVFTVEAHNKAGASAVGYTMAVAP